MSQSKTINEQLLSENSLTLRGFICNIRLELLHFQLEIFLLCLSLKTLKNSSGQMLQLYEYVANESTLNKLAS